MLDGFGGWARFPWAAYIPPSGNLLLAALPGAVVFTGKTEVFAVSEKGGVGPFSLSGVTAAFGTVVTEIPGAFAFTGVVSASFRISEAGQVGGAVLSGVATTDMIGEVVNPNGAFTTGGISAGFNIFVNDQAGAFTQSAFSQILTRDFINWVNLPFEAGSWSREASPSSPWTVSGSQAPSWNVESISTPVWSPLAPPVPNWTIDPAQQILPPVSE
jgi:hypothetical protein